MSDTELLFFPRGQIGIDGGNPQQITDFNSAFANGAKLKHTLRANPAGITLGQKTLSFDFNIIIDEDGEEIDWDRKVDTGESTTLVCKKPGGVTKVLIGVISEASEKFSIDDGVARAIKGIGKVILPSV